MIDIKYLLVIYELKIYSICPTTSNTTSKLLEISMSIPIEVLQYPLGLWVEWINRWHQEKNRRIQRMVRNKEMDGRKSYGFAKTLSIGTKKEISK